MTGPVLITGAAGRIGTWLRGGLPERGWAIRSLDVVPMPDSRPGEEQVVADVTDLAAMVDATVGASAVVHLAGIATESTWPAIRHANIEGTYAALEAARRAGVGRVVLASSNHAAGCTPRPGAGLLTEADAPPRPDTYYGVSKVTMEALGSLYVDRYGLDVVCLRIGSAFAEPTTVRQLATWLSPADTVGLVDAALRAPAPGFAVVWGISANTRGWWDLTAARALGYEPVDDAEVYAAALLAAHGEPDPADPVHTRVGGEYTLPQFDAEWVEAQQAAAPALLDAARAWAADDPHDGDRAELEALIAAGDTAELERRFAGPLTFGTAGLRGPLRAGPAGMNAAVVTRAAAGLARYLADAGHGGGGVVIGYDARHRSDEFARVSAEVLAGAGFAVSVLPRPLPTPVLCYAVRQLGAVAGVMVTASHNPPRDNGYKVYLGDGAQLVPPADRQIEAAIAAVGPACEVLRSDEWLTLGDDVEGGYVAAVVDALQPGRVPVAARQHLTVAYTAMHGVGAQTTRAVFDAAGFGPLHSVAQQDRPDPDFPTVAFPNPEEPGAVDLLLALAEGVGADVGIAEDPDADRCSVVCGGRQLTGDEVGALLADWLLRRGVRGTYAASLVSGSLLYELTRAHGVPFAETPTGFKWIIRAGSPEAPLVFGYEEALGYSVTPSVARDKDGVSAALAVALLAAELSADGRTLTDRLDELAREHGLFATGQFSVRVGDLAVISAAMARLRANPPTTLLGRGVQATDLAQSDPPVDAVRLLGDGVRAIVRPSGTEPKLKAYLESVVPVHEDAGVLAARGRGADELDRLRAEMAAALGL